MSTIFADPDDQVEEIFRSSNERLDYNWSHLFQGRQLIGIHPSSEVYDFPRFVVDFSNRDKMLRLIVPELVSRKVFDMNDIVSGLMASVNWEESNEQLFRKMLEDLLTSYISCIHDFKVFILHAGFQEYEVNERMEKSCDFFVLEKQPVKSKPQVMNCLRKIGTQYHHLTMVNPADLWTMLVINGCFRELKDRPKLLSLCPPYTYNDISEFIADHISNYDWSPHCYLPTEIYPPDDNADLGTRIRREICDGSYQCAICTDNVQCSDSFWPCSRCFRVFHMKCMQDWFSYHRRCPMCKENYSSDDLVRRCWCKRILNPAESRDNPGSCGSICGATVFPGSGGSACTLTCHAGPHRV